jgi:LuxR family maltose regulon positive regulatory protein
VLDHLEGDDGRALAGIRTVVAEAEQDGDIGLLRSAGHSVQGLLRALDRDAPSRFVRSVLNRPFNTVQIRPVRDLTDQLTMREQVVLAMLPTRLSNAEIAERLDVSVNTVKTHLKHIYRKLDVVGRNRAVEAAERLRLL